MMFCDQGALISGPAFRLAQANVESSVVEVEHLLEQPLDCDLRMAITLIQQICTSEQLPTYFVVRPEMFTNSTALDWLRARIGRVRDHICISDGRTIRLIPGMKNHVFFLQLGAVENFDLVKKLQMRCPELIPSLESQINSLLPFKAHEALPLVVLQPQACPALAPSFFPFCLVRHSIEESVRQVLSAGKVDILQAFRGCDRLTYIPLTEVALASEGFCRLIASRIARAYFDRAEAVVLVLPDGGRGEADCSSALAKVMKALRGVPASIPPARSSRVLFSSAACPDDLLFFGGRDVELILHHSVDAWMRCPEHYSRFGEVTLAASWPSRGRDLLVEFASAILGRKPAGYWLEHSTAEPNDAGIGVL